MRRFGWTDQSSVDLFGDRSETETLSQALSTAAADEADEADADGSVLFGTLRGNVVGLKYYTGVVCIYEFTMDTPYNTFIVWMYSTLAWYI